MPIRLYSRLHGLRRRSFWKEAKKVLRFVRARRFCLYLREYCIERKQTRKCVMFMLMGRVDCPHVRLAIYKEAGIVRPCILPTMSRQVKPLKPTARCVYALPKPLIFDKNVHIFRRLFTKLPTSAVAESSPTIWREAGQSRAT